jgi:hypothetical protein
MASRVEKVVVVVMGRLLATGIRFTLGTPKGYTINPI